MSILTLALTGGLRVRLIWFQIEVANDVTTAFSCHWLLSEVLISFELFDASFEEKEF